MTDYSLTIFLLLPLPRLEVAWGAEAMPRAGRRCRVQTLTRPAFDGARHGRGPQIRKHEGVSSDDAATAKYVAAPVVGLEGQAGPHPWIRARSRRRGRAHPEQPISCGRNQEPKCVYNEWVACWVAQRQSLRWPRTARERLGFRARRC